MTLPRWLGITGYAGSGKDTVAQILQELAGYKRFALADRLKEMVYELNPWASAPHDPPIPYTEPEHERLQTLVDEIGWDRAKRNYPEVRRLLQDFGVMMRATDESFWINRMVESVDQHYRAFWHIPRESRLTVVPDVRFVNEAEWIRAQMVGQPRGRVIRVVRPSVGPLNDHESEAGIPAHLIDYTIHNDGTTQDLADKVSTLLRELNPDAVSEANAAVQRAFERRD